MSSIDLSKSYVIFTPKTKEVCRFSNKEIVIYADISEAEEDCIEGEIVISVNELPNDLKQAVINQIKSND
jgi:hypothetical protein